MGRGVNYVTSTHGRTVIPLTFAAVMNILELMAVYLS